VLQEFYVTVRRKIAVPLSPDLAVDWISQFEAFPCLPLDSALVKIANITQVDVVLPTRNGITIRKRCVSKPTKHQAILLQRLGLKLPASKKITGM